MRVNAGDRLKLAVAGSGSAQDLYQRVCRAEREALQSTLDGNSVELLLAFTPVSYTHLRLEPVWFQPFL